jgi:hypothetical protein
VLRAVDPCGHEQGGKTKLSGNKDKVCTMSTFRLFIQQPTFRCKICDALEVPANATISYACVHTFSDHLRTHIITMPIYWRIWIAPLCPNSVTTQG